MDIPINAVQIETRKLKRELTLLPLFGLIYFTVCGGTFGIESLIGFSGPGLALTLIIITPIIFSLPTMLMVRELNSMMPVEGGYYHWIKRAFGPFFGFLSGWMSWVVSWVDAAIYPVLAAYYLGYFLPPLRQGLQVSGIQIDAWLLQWGVAIVLIGAISWLNVRGARLAALTTTWMGVVMMLPVIVLSALGIYNWVHGGAQPLALPFMPAGQSWTQALSVGLFVIMWNYMGWELPTVAGDEIVNPKRTYPLAMLLVLVAAIASYGVPVLSSLYGGAGEGGRYMMWGVQEEQAGQGIGPVLEQQGISQSQLTQWGVDPSNSNGWELPDIAHAVAAKAAGGNLWLAGLLGSAMTIAAMLSMIGQFTSNSLSGSRLPFALAEDGMMPQWMVKIHPRYGTPWVAILICGIIFAIFSLQAFAFLVVVDVFLNVIVTMGCFGALWKLRFSEPDLPRQKVPGGVAGLVLITIGPAAITALAIYSQVAEESLNSLWLALVAIAVGVVLYWPMHAFIKRDIPDVDPLRFHAEEAAAKAHN